MSSEQLDLVVVGGGVFGLGAALEAARRGRRTVVLERGSIPNPIAASYGPSRKIRSTYTDPHYARLARRAMEGWRQIEREVGQELMIAAGNLAYTALDDQPHLDELEAVARRVGAPIERLDGCQVAARFPQFVRARRAILETDAGFLRASACVAALRALAEGAGVTVRTQREVTSVRDDGDAAVVELADGQEVRADRVILALGGWSKRLLPDLADTLVQSQQGLMYLADVSPAFQHPSFPAFSCPDTGFYGFPSYGGEPMKVALHILGDPIPSPDFDRSTSPPGFVEGITGFLRDDLGLDPDDHSVRVESCMYNLSPSSDFLLDFHPSRPRLFVATGGSGHGFKFGSVIGAAIMDRLDGVAGDPWSPQFSWESVTRGQALARPR